MIIEAFGEKKDVMEWLEDPRIDPEVTRDVLVKRTRRSKMDGETAITMPVIKGAAIGDTKKRIDARNEKMEYRVRMFILSQDIRYQYEKGISIEELMDRFSVSKSQINKISAKQEWYNVHWRGYKRPEKFKDIIEKINYKKVEG